MRIGILSDIHGNIYAFEKVAKNIKKEKLDGVVFLGDLVFMGLYPQECYDQLKTLDIMFSVKGNTDSNIEEFQEFIPKNDYENKLYKMIEFTDSKINLDRKNELKGWNILERRKFEEKNIIFCHGSPYSFKDKIEKDGEDLIRIGEKIKKEKADLIFCGHTHKKERFKIESKEIINFGAIGYSFDKTAKTRYGIFEIDNGIKYEFIELDYEIEKYKKDVRNKNLPWGEDLLFNLENGLSGKF